MTAATTVPSKKASSRIPLTLVVALVPAAAALNIVGGYINNALHLPIFLDMIGTCVAAIVLGPWWGSLVGVITNVGGSFFTGPIGIPFALANVAGALVWGYGVRSWGMGSTGHLLPAQHPRRPRGLGRGGPDRHLRVRRRDGPVARRAAEHEDDDRSGRGQTARATRMLTGSR